jgi:hypothetical protein
MLTTGIGYSGRAALRREQCDVHAVGLRSRRYLVMARPLNSVKAAFSMWSDPRLYSQGSSSQFSLESRRVG